MFCLHTAKSHEHYDPLATAQWVFYVLSRSAIESRDSLQMGVAALRTLVGEPVDYTQLQSRIAAVAGQH